MTRRLHALRYAQALRGVILFFLGAVAPLAVKAQEILPGSKNQAVVLDITTRVAQQQRVMMNSTESRVTVPGKQVGVRLQGDNTVIEVHFTPYLAEKGEYLLVTQSQIWVNVPNEGIRYQTSIQSVPMNFGDQVLFLPLGNADAPRIELEILLRRFEEKDAQTVPPAGSRLVPGKP